MPTLSFILALEPQDSLIKDLMDVGIFEESRPVQRLDSVSTVYYIKGSDGEIKITETHEIEKTAMLFETKDTTSVLELKKSGEVFIDGFELIAETISTSPGQDQFITPRLSTWVYSDIPYYTGGSYSIDGGSTVSNIQLEKKIAEYLQEALFLAIVSRLPFAGIKDLADKGLFYVEGLRLFIEALQTNKPNATVVWMKEQIWYNTYTVTSPKVIRYTKHVYDYYYDRINNVLTGYVSSDTAYGKLTYQT